MPLVVAGDADRLDDLLRLCAAAGTEPEVVFDAPPSLRSWREAPLVVVGEEASARVYAAARAARRRGVLLIGRAVDGTSDADGPEIWRTAVRIGAEQVLTLPADEGRLVGALADAAEGGGPEAAAVGVVGARGGAGASSLACALACGAVRAGHRALLVDADPFGGGLELLLGGERETGLRWSDLGETRGRVSAAALAEALPGPHGVPVVSFDDPQGAAAPPEAMAAVVAAARRRGGLVVADLPRWPDAAALEALARMDAGLLVVPAELRAVAAARRVAATAGAVLRDLRVVARGPAPSRMDGEAVARALGLPLAGELDAEPGLAEAQERGVPPGARPGPLARFADGFVRRVLNGGGPDGAGHGGPGGPR